MVTEDGHTKIIDFGLAKLVEPLAGEGSDIETLTRGETDPGKVMGTVSYMSPEQARGEKVDHRSDIFSFGIVLHEMLTGELPFRGPSAPETLSAIINAPTPELELPAHQDMAPELQRVMDKCLAKEPAERYQGMKDLVVDLRALRRRLDSGAVAPLSSPRQHKRLFYVGVGIVAAVLLLAALLPLFRPSQAVPTTADTKSKVAVLFFDNNSGDESLDWLRTALADMLITGLSQSSRVQVLSTDRLYQFLEESHRQDEKKTSSEMVREIADRAGATNVLLGSFVKAGETIRISVRLQDSQSGEILATQKVEGEGEPAVFEMVNELTRQISSQLGVSAQAGQDRLLRDVTTSSVEALRYYTEAWTFHRQGKTQEAIALHTKALEEDPTLAAAMIGLSMAYSNLGQRKEAEEYVSAALKNADRLTLRYRYYAEAWRYALREETWGKSFEAWKKLIEIDPDWGRQPWARRLMIFERFDEAIPLFLEDRRLRPNGIYITEQLPQCYAQKGQFEKGFEVLEDFLNRNPKNAHGHFSLGLHYLRWGKLDEALDELKKGEVIAPLDPFLHRAQWTAFILVEDLENAEMSAKRIAGSLVWRAIGQQCLSVLRLYQGRSRESLEILERSIIEQEGLQTFSAGSRNSMASILLFNGKAEDALQHAEAAQNEGRGDSQEWRGLFIASLSRAMLGRWDQARHTADNLEMKATALPTQKERRRYQHLLGALGLTKGDAKAAIAHLEQAQAMLTPRGFNQSGGRLPQHVPIWFDLAQAYLAAGENAKATATFRRIVEQHYGASPMAHPLRSQLLLPGQDPREPRRDGQSPRILPPLLRVLERRRHGPRAGGGSEE